MHIYFSGIGGAGIGPLALVAHQAGYEVSGSDSKNSQYTEYLKKQGIKLHIGQTKEAIKKEHSKNPIDWMVFSSAVLIDNPKNEELVFAKYNNIKISKRDECLNMILEQKSLKLIAVAGTHGKTTTTAMLVWLFKSLDLPISYSVGAKTIFGPMGFYDPKSEYFIYECDEFDHNFLSFKPEVSVITVVDWDHHEIYPTRQDYKQAFVDFINQSQKTFILQKDANYLKLKTSQFIKILSEDNKDLTTIKLAGLHNRQNAYVAVSAISSITDIPISRLINIVNQFPGSSRRFEKLANKIYTDYAHTPEEVAATMQMAKELSNDIIVVYEPLTDRRQHYMKDQYKDVFSAAKKVYWVPSYLAREDPSQKILSPKELIKNLQNTNAVAAKLNVDLKEKLNQHIKNGDLVVCMAGGGGGSLDEWARKQFVKK
jgi:UDP-N-acetylmuramate--alanine ligase